MATVKLAKQKAMDLPVVAEVELRGTAQPLREEPSNHPAENTKVQPVVQPAVETTPQVGARPASNGKGREHRCETCRH